MIPTTPEPATIPAITLWQPWASFIAWGWKTIETRAHNRFARLVGQRIAIHAGLCPCFPEMFGLILEDIAPLKTPIAYKGRQGIFHVPLEIVYP